MYLNVNKKSQGTIRFEKKDVLKLTPQELEIAGPFSLIICNPPYIHTSDPSVSRSVRKWEPALALYPLPRPSQPDPISSSQETPCKDEDIFYQKVLSLTQGASINRIILMEIGSQDQAIRVVRLATQLGLSPNDIVEIWRDWPDQKPTDGEATRIAIDGRSYTVRGSGLCRSVVIRRVAAPLSI